VELLCCAPVFPRPRLVFVRLYILEVVNIGSVGLNVAGMDTNILFLGFQFPLLARERDHAHDSIGPYQNGSVLRVVGKDCHLILLIQTQI